MQLTNGDNPPSGPPSGPPPGPPSGLRDFLGLERNVITMMSARAIQGFGVALWLGYLPKVLETLGARGAIIGAFGTLGALLWVVFPYLGGVLSDRLGRGRAMILASALAAMGYVFYMLAPAWWFFIPGLVLTSVSASFDFMGALALTGDAVRSDRRATSMAVQGMVGRLPALACPPLGGALIMWLGLVRGVRAGLFITILLTLLAIWLQRRYYRTPPPAGRKTSLDVRSAWRAMHPDLKRLLAADCLARFGLGISAIFIVLYAFNVLQVSALHFGFLQSFRTLVWVGLSFPAGKLADRRGKASRLPFVTMGFFLMAAFPVALLLAPSAAWLLAAFALAGLFDVCEGPRKSLIVDLAEGGNRGSIIGAYHLVRGAVVFPAASIGGWLWEWRPAAPFLLGACITALGLLCFLLLRPKASD